MTLKTLVVASLAAVCAAGLMAEPAPKPGPEHKKLDYFLGSWTIESESKASPFGPAGKNTGTQVGEKGPGSYSVILRSDFKTPMGPMQGVGVMSYDSHTKTYVYNGVDSMGV